MKTADIIKRRIELKRQHIILLEAEIESLEDILENEVGKNNRFLLLPAANDPIAYPKSNWATSYHCDSCGCADYDQTHDGKGIMPFYRDTVSGDLVCGPCAMMGDK